MWSRAVGALRKRVLSMLGRAVTRVEVNGLSMLPVLAPGDRLLVWRTRRFSPGELIVFEHPSEAGRVLVKRVSVCLAEGLIVVGDNSVVSTDSRHFGPVSLQSVIGRPWYRYFPLEARGRLRRR